MFLFSFRHKLNHSEKENEDDRMIKIWTKLNDPNAIINLQFYIQHELQKFELTLDQLSCEEAMKNFQFLLNKCVEKFVPSKKRQQYQNFKRTKDKNDQLKFNALRNKLQKQIRRKKEMYYQRLMNVDGQNNSKSFFDCISRLKGKVASQDRLNKETADKFIDYFFQRVKS